jgi:hypothetical protein
MVNNPTQLEEVSANPFAARVSTSQPYGDISDWGDWTLDDWQAGVGHKDVDSGGNLYASLDSRFPNQLILPFGIDFPLISEYISNIYSYKGFTPYTGEEIVVDGNPYTGIVSTFLGGADSTVNTMWIYVDAPEGTNVTFKVSAEVLSYSPIVVANGYAVVEKSKPGPHWQRFDFDEPFYVNGSETWIYHIRLEGNDSFSCPSIENYTQSYYLIGDEPTFIDCSFSFITSSVSVESQLSFEGGGLLLLENGDGIELLVGDVKLNWLVMAFDRQFGAYSNKFVEVNFQSGEYP